MPHFDRVVVISLARRPERLTAFLDRLAAAWPTAPIQAVPAVDGQLAPQPDWWTATPGAWGCYRSHQRVLEDAIHAGVESLLIFEDDATFAEDFPARLEAYWAALPEDAGQIYLGGQHLQPPQPVNDLVVRGTNVNRTHAYAVRGAAAIRELYRWCHSGRHWRGRHHVDHHYGRQHVGGVPAYAPKRWLCGQAAGPSDIASRPSAERWWQPPERRHARP